MDVVILVNIYLFKQQDFYETNLVMLFRFVSYFICPVFHEQTIQKEIEIIQCEHQKNKQNDVWRANQV